MNEVTKKRDFLIGFHFFIKINSPLLTFLMSLFSLNAKECEASVLLFG